MRKDNRKKTDLINSDIKAPEVRVFGIDGELVGILPTKEAQAMANSEGVDLVLITANAKPPVVRIIDYGKYRYEKQRKEKELKKNQKNQEQKEIRITPQIDEHDLETKVKHAFQFLEKGHKVQFTVLFRGRQMANRELGEILLREVAKKLEESAQVDQYPKNEGRKMFLVLSPIKK